LKIPTLICFALIEEAAPFRKVARANPERIEIIQPRVARHELPWVNGNKTINPERVVSNPADDSTLSGLMKWFGSSPGVAVPCQPSRTVNAGLNDGHPVGMAATHLSSSPNYRAGCQSAMAGYRIA